MTKIPVRVALVLSVFLTASWAVLAQSESSLRWTVTIDKSELGVNAGEVAMYGVQRELRIRLSIANSAGPRIVGADSLVELVRVDVERDGEDVPIQLEAKTTGLPSGAFLEPSEAIRALVTVRRLDGAAFVAGRYRVTVSLVGAVNSLLFSDGTPWMGRAKLEETRQIVLHEVQTFEERVAFLSIEGNFHMGEGEYREALPYLEELVRLTPGAWQPNAALGVTLIRLARYRAATVPLERALPGWLRFGERRGDVVPNDLARAYLALNSEESAVRALRTGGVPELAIPQRIRELKTAAP